MGHFSVQINKLNKQIFITTHSQEMLDRLVTLMDEYEKLDVSVYRCFRTDTETAINMYSKEELGLREQLDIELR